ncbi:MAG TPA: phytoene/squalene synthase family protein [Pyrinomonadaceae bacterium]|jgi:phytoene synthase
MIGLHTSEPGANAAGAAWGAAEWAERERRVRERALRERTEPGAWRVLVRESRAVMRAYTTSFFVVSRFLPQVKRDEVEAIYAAVRYPDEVVDTFRLGRSARLWLLEDWRERYEEGLACGSLRESLERGVPSHLAGFVRVVRERGIPHGHYHAFLDAMRLDVDPRPFRTLGDLIDSYVYGSAVVVGYFLAHVYGARDGADFGRALSSARHLGIALQLTNFLRDVAEDQRRGRVYLPADALRAEGIDALDAYDPRQQEKLKRVRRRLALIADELYARAAADLDAFSPDCRPAVRSCIEVYGRLNRRVARSERGVSHRESVPLREKFEALPASKYWRIPLAYLTR